MVIIGSGATAVTLVPAMAESAGHVTMLQRSPTYVIPVPSKDRIANTLPKLVGRDRAYALTRKRTSPNSGSSGGSASNTRRPPGG
ncbi:hypothetical protein NIIDMKKI_79700 [Mycobacterium kansasii]|uniref:Uncharacterized protein n=1 Tax=Mycobacterium kansasii TaxID=1768 RepID=A0A7G1IQU7_MYCKA|nr:hypothetical protein NIIDMKKI_79700 [Mycobacterium kansasii]